MSFSNRSLLSIISILRSIAIYAGALGCLAFHSSALSAQGLSFGNPYFASPGMPPRLAVPPFDFDTWNSPAPERPSIGPPMVSADVLRHPLASKALLLLIKANHLSKAGDHTAALGVLQAAFIKFPSSAPYIQNMMGIEYAFLRQFSAAKDQFASVIKAMPHLSANHSNYAMTLAELGENERAEQSLRTALALDENNQIARRMLDDLRRQSNAAATGAPAGKATATSAGESAPAGSRP